MSSFDKTMKFNFPEESMEQEVKQVMLQVHSALEEKGYNPINQIVGYFFRVIQLIFLAIKMHVI